MQSLMSVGFEICASSGAGVEGQQFSEYVFRRRRRRPSLAAELPLQTSRSSSGGGAGVIGGGGMDSGASNNTSDSADLPLLPVIKRERLSD